MNINVKQGNATNLSMYEDNTFDVTLCLGPLYHLFTEEDKRKAISEAIRVTKTNGIIYFSFITNDAVMLADVLRKGNIKRVAELSDEQFRFKNIPEEIFSTEYVQEFNKRMNEYNVKCLHNVATEGILEEFAEYVNKLDEEEYEILIKYHLATCEREDLMGFSSHVLYICKKEKE